MVFFSDVWHAVLTKGGGLQSGRVGRVFGLGGLGMFGSARWPRFGFGPQARCFGVGHQAGETGEGPGGRFTRSARPDPILLIQSTITPRAGEGDPPRVELIGYPSNKGGPGRFVAGLQGRRRWPA